MTKSSNTVISAACMYSAVSELERIVSDHERILAAIGAGDPLAAQDHLRIHLSGTLETIEKIRQQQPHFFTQR